MVSFLCINDTFALLLQNDFCILLDVVSQVSQISSLRDLIQMDVN